MDCVRFVFWGLMFFGGVAFCSWDFYGVFFGGVAIRSFFLEFTIIGISYLFSFFYYFLLAVPGKFVLLFILLILFLYYFYYFYKFVRLLSPVFFLFSLVLLIWLRLELLPMALFLVGSSFNYFCVFGLLAF